MNRLLLALALAAAAFAQRPPLPVVESGIADLRAAMRKGKLTSHELTRQYLIRIALFEDQLNAIIAVNPRVLEDAAQRDRERGKRRGPLHGIPIALKDNIHATGMSVTGGALAFDGLIPPYEATLVKNLREAGAVIIAKTGLTELANWVAGGPTPMPGNYSAIAGFGFNPYDPRRDPRESTRDGRPVLSPSGSSSGIGTAASFWAANVGTETSGSILSPSNQNMLVGIKPTVGRISRYGVIPITADQDTAGPMARTVADAAILLGAMEGAAPDPHDPATGRCPPPPGRDYTKFLNRRGLRGARIGIPRAWFFDALNSRGGLTPAQKTAMEEAIAVLKREGAVVVDPADIPSVLSGEFQNWNTCSGAGSAKGRDENCSVVFKYGMKRDFNLWLKSLGEAAPVKTLTALREFNLAHQRAGAIRYGQSQLDISDEMDLEADRPRYQRDRAKDLELAAARGIDQAMKQHRLDALLFPGSAGASIAAKPGYPTIIIPFATVPVDTTDFPAGFQPKPAPLGVSFNAMACAEPRLIEIGYAFEQATRRRVAPALP
ncbi:MAG: amidase family protein [Bryobacteraceae bacterium]|nr:amidase family protein [Bryobacteraceae bacterium]